MTDRVLNMISDSSVDQPLAAVIEKALSGPSVSQDEPRRAANGLSPLSFFTADFD